ncbi:MAG: hypothetical protein M1832_005240 [Thelocarpon impressellum]|nr:MAG: hypothetical protein M1832_005240 [Thelocarpon impressellum]
MDGGGPSTPSRYAPHPAHSLSYGVEGSSTRPARSTLTPPSAGSSTNTYLMPVSPLKGRPAGCGGYRPKISRTSGQRPACLVNASVTYCGENRIFAFGGFDQYTDEVYNHVLQLDLNSLRWTLVDNYGDIPGVRMGHTATLYQGDKLLIYGGENEHRVYLSDVMMFDLKTAHWTQPVISGPVPRGRARHAAALHEDKLFIVGGVTGHSNSVLNDLCYLDLKTWTWSRTWSFVGRFDHTAWVWGGRLWVFGGLGEDMDRGGEIWWLDLNGNPAFDDPANSGAGELQASPAQMNPGGRVGYNAHYSHGSGSTGYAANSSSVQVNPPCNARPSPAPAAPGAISSVNFVSGPNVPSQASGSHFHVYSSGTLLDFVTPASTIRSTETSLSSLELDSLHWQKLAEGAEIFDPGYRWHYCAMNQEGTKAWLLGCATDVQNVPGGGVIEEDLCDVLAIDLKKFGLLGSEEPRSDGGKNFALDRHTNSPLSGLGLDIGGMFDVSPDVGSGADFVVTAEPDDDSGVDEDGSWVERDDGLTTPTATSAPIHVHKLILQSRWPHFKRLWAAQMAEFHTKKMHIPEPYRVVRAFLYYLYTDNISRHSKHCADLGEVAGLLVMANVYDMPRLRLMCVNRLGRELDVEHAAVVWERAGTAEEEWLRRRAATFCLTYWGRVVRTQGFHRLNRHSLVELCAEIDMEGRVVGGQELEVVGGLGGSRFGSGGVSGAGGAKARSSSASTYVSEEPEDGGGGEDEGMEMS